MVQAVLASALRNSSHVVAAREALPRRPIALGDAHDIMPKRGRARVAGAGRPYGWQRAGGRIGQARFSGSECEGGAKAALQVALMLHELTANAMKFGALSTTKRPVEVAWSVAGGDGEPVLMLSRRERGGSPVEPSSRKGNRDPPEGGRSHRSDGLRPLAGPTRPRS